MIKKLKRKFIATLMIYISIVIAAVLISVNVTTYRNASNEVTSSLQTMSKIMNIDDSQPKDAVIENPREDEGKGNNRPWNLPQVNGRNDSPTVAVFSVLLDADSQIVKQQGFGVEMDETALSECITEVTAQNIPDAGKGIYGKISKYNIMFYAVKSDAGTVVSFASLDSVEHQVVSTVLVSSGIAVVAIVLLYFVSRLLATMFVRPVEKAWIGQKQFVADASHDLKTPLTVILANTNILLSHKDQSIESQEKWLTSTCEEGEHMKSLIENMIELAKSEEMQTKLVLSEVNLSEVVNGVALQFDPVAFEKNISLETEIEDGITLTSDANAVTRLCYILIDNAIKYSNQMPVTVSLKKTKQEVSLSVCNRGGVISKEDLEHIFERFYRSDKMRSTEGHGLGLAIAKNISESLGAEITASSSETDGTIFTVHFRKK